MSRACEIEGCDKLAGRGGGRYCSMHYSRIRRNGDPMVRALRIRAKDQACTVGGCDNPQAGRGLCARHWMQWRRRGDPVAPRLMGDPWTPEEDRHLLDLIRDPRGGLLERAPRGELEAVAMHLGRTVAAARSRLFRLKRVE